MALRFPVSAMALLLLLVLAATTTRAEDDSSSSAFAYSNQYTNVYNEELQPCSSEGMALTGFTRSGYCIDQSDDSGSHHVCLDLSSLGGGNDNNGQNQNFCTVTGQSDWCSSEDMPCHEDPSDYSCPVTNWCVCQWAFASYVAKMGCNNIQTVVCDAVNVEAFYAYEQLAYSYSHSSADRQKYKTAMFCLVEKCGVPQRTRMQILAGRVSSPGFQTTMVLLFVGAAVYGAHVYSKRNQRSSIDLNPEDVELKPADSKLAFNPGLISLT